MCMMALSKHFNYIFINDKYFLQDTIQLVCEYLFALYYYSKNFRTCIKKRIKLSQIYKSTYIEYLNHLDSTTVLSSIFLYLELYPNKYNYYFQLYNLLHSLVFCVNISFWRFRQLLAFLIILANNQKVIKDNRNVKLDFFIIDRNWCFRIFIFI